MVVPQRKSQVEHFIVCSRERTSVWTSPLDFGLDVEKDSSAVASPLAAGAGSSPAGLDSTGDVSGLAAAAGILAELGDGERDLPAGPLLALGLSGPLPASWRSRCE